MPKNIILLSDGTGNSAAKLSKTNVWRLYQALDLSGPTPANPNVPVQIAHYDDGVGTSAFRPYAILGGAFGLGLKRIVIDLYTFLCRNYETQDRIYAFGFSRGAFAIRILTGLIANQGLVQAPAETDLRRQATEAYRAYRAARYTARKWFLARHGRPLRNFILHHEDRLIGRGPCTRMHDGPPPIAFLGLWDTVAAYGLPLAELTRAWDWVFPLSTPDRNPSEIIDRACHALCLDDERETFHPVLWNESHLPGQNKNTTRMADERISQVWFAGMHSNVGGGYPDDALAYVSLDWIMGEAEDAGLVFKAGERAKVQAAKDVCGKMYDSRRGLGGTYRYLPRKMAELTDDTSDPPNRVFIPRPKIHESVFERVQKGIDGYAPIVLPPRYAVAMASGDILDLSSSTSPPWSPPPMEHSTQALDRSHQQEKVWNLVWWKRLAYFTSMIPAAGLIAFPLYRPATTACAERSCWLSAVISGIGTFLPNFVNPWFAAYQSHPLWFILLVGLMSTLIWLGSRLQARLFDEMRALWLPIREKPGTCIVPAGLPVDRLYRLRSQRMYVRFFGQMKRSVLPLVVGAVALWLLAAGFSQGVFAVWSSLGLVCPPTRTDRLTEGVLLNGQFSSRDVCWASGVRIKEGKRYRVTLTINDPTQWMDGDRIRSPVNGFGAELMAPLMYPGIPLRRHVREPWFKPIARIGSQGNDEYPLDPIEYAIPTQTPNQLVAEFVARREGELFLFVNDAVLPVPNPWQVFYRNNRGSASVSVRPVSPNGTAM